MMRDPVTFDARELRTALGAFPTGVTVITTEDAQGGIHGLTANSFNAVSLDPPLILWSQSKKAGSYEAFRAASEFAISILSEDQLEVSARFASRHADKFAGVEIDRTFCGLPVIAASSAWLHCRTVSQVDGGDHTIYIGEIRKIARTGRRPLVFGGGQYMLVQPHHALMGGAVVPSGARQRLAVRISSPYMQRIAEDLDVQICISVWGNCGPTIVAWEAGASHELPGFPLGIVLPVTTSATGQAFGAYLDPASISEFVEREFSQAAVAGRSAMELRAQWLAALGQVRADGIARNSGIPFWKHPMLISGASIPVRDSNGEAIAAVAIVAAPGKDASLLERACVEMKAAVGKIEAQLGYRASTCNGRAGRGDGL